jgi:hypothetical protein
MVTIAGLTAEANLSLFNKPGYHCYKEVDYWMKKYILSSHPLNNKKIEINIIH